MTAPPPQDGRLRTGDHILRIGATPTGGLSSDQVVRVLQGCGSTVTMVIARDPRSPGHAPCRSPALQAINVLLLLFAALLGGLLVADLPADLLQDPLLLLTDRDTGNRDMIKAGRGGSH